MFEIGFGEIIVIIVVACYVLEVRDLPSLIRNARSACNYINKIIKEIKNFIFELEQETIAIIDLEGKERIAYKVDDILPDIKKEKIIKKDDCK